MFLYGADVEVYMRAAVYTEFGGPNDIEIVEMDEPEPGPGEAVVEVEASSINYHDLWVLKGTGRMVSEDPPFLSGVDLAGTVDRVGEDVTNVAPGDQVVLCPNRTCGSCRFCREGPENMCEEYSLYHGGFAELASVRADRLIRLPNSVDTTTAAVLPVAYMTAWHMLRRADVEAGDTVFVPGATGGIGTAAVRLVDVLGGRSIGTTTSPKKRRRLEEIGTDHVIQSGDIEEIRDSVLEIGEPDVALNHLSGPFTDLCLSLLRRGGTLVSCGSSVSTESEINVRETYIQHKRALGSTMGTQTNLETVLEFVAEGRFTPVIGSEYPLDDIDEAFREMQRRDLFGKAAIHVT